MREIGATGTGSELGLTEGGTELGLVETYAYHCYRCNYTWLPKDFDRLVFVGTRYGKQQKSWGEDLLYREPPKSCARCKSKSWKEIIPRRKLKQKHALESEIWISAELRNDLPWMTSVARLRALNRQGRLTPKNIRQF